MMALGAAANPVVFLHGWNSDASIWDSMKGLLVSDAGYASTNLFALDYYADNNSDSACTTSTDIKEVAEFCAREIKEFYLRHGSQPVDLVCHSMGGLIARSMLEYGMIEPQCLRRYIPIATPHYGVAINEALLVNFQARQMYCGSDFLWDLAARWQFLRKRFGETLCISGINTDVSLGSSTAYGDGLVECWSAALGDEPCRYVKKHHASSPWSDPIYQCKSTGTDAYKLVRGFLAGGTAIPQGDLDFTPPTTAMSQGAVFLQVVEPGPRPVSYADKAGLERIARVFTNAVTGAKVDTPTVYHGSTGTSGLGNGVELVAGTLPAATYDATILRSTTTGPFVAHGIPVMGGRTTVVRVITTGKLQLKPQTFLLIN